MSSLPLVTDPIAVASNNCARDCLHKDCCTQAFGRNTLSKPHTGADTDRCPEHLRAALSHDVILRGDDIPQLCKSWDDNITDLVSGIPLKLLPIWEVNHEINLIDPEKCIHYWLLRCPEHFHEELSQKIERYTTAQWWIPTVAYQAVPLLCIPKKNSKLCTVFNLREQNDNTVKDVTPFPDQDIICNDMARATYRSKLDLSEVLWGLLKVFLPKACTQRSLCRRSLAQLFKATAIGSVTRSKLDNYEKECDVWCVTVTCYCVTIRVTWLSGLDLMYAEF